MWSKEQKGLQKEGEKLEMVIAGTKGCCCKVNLPILLGFVVYFMFRRRSIKTLTPGTMERKAGDTRYWISDLPRHQHAVVKLYWNLTDGRVR